MFLLVWLLLFGFALGFGVELVVDLVCLIAVAVLVRCYRCFDVSLIVLLW